MDLSKKTLYALLIGIDRYLPNSLYRNLRGCVRDIQSVEDYLQTALDVSKANIWKLTSSAPDDSALADVRSAEQPPTYCNIVSAFQAITEKASSGEQVYIHYSGHGGRAKTIYPDIKGTTQSDETIVPTDFCAADGRYLRDVELATLLKQMTDKGLIVTVVLDSCHSGGATRGDDCAIRGGDAVDLIPQAMESLVAAKETLQNNWLSLTSGHPHSAESSAAWLPASREYVCLAACRPSEQAHEYSANGKARNGALTFWMIDTLKNNSLPNLDYRALYERISTKIQGRFPNQMPMLMGEENRLVFGTNLANRPYSVPVLSCNLAKQQMQLKVGLAQGISRGSQFSIYPLGIADFSQTTQKLALVEVSHLEATSCTATIVPVEEGGIDVTAQLAANQIDKDGLEGAPAVMESAPVELKRRVRLIDDKAVGDREFELPSQLANQQVAALQKVREAMANNGWLIAFEGEEDAPYQVAINREGAYEICMGLPVKNLRPPIAIEETEAASKVIERLVHLAKYQSVQTLDNPKSRLSALLQVDLMQQPGWQPGDSYNLIPFDNPNAVELSVGDFAFLRIINRAQIDLNVAVLDLDPVWAISKLPILNLPGSFYTMSPGEEQVMPLSFSLPSGPDDQPLYAKVTETIKVFAAIGAADFSLLELPPLDVPIASKGNTRGSDSGTLNRLMSAIDAESPATTRAIAVVTDPNQDWATQQIQFTLSQ